MAISPKDRYASIAEMLENLPQPPKEILKSETNLLSSAEEEETTMLNTPLSKENDATIILPEHSNQVVKKKRKTLLVSLLITGFIIIASASVWLFSDQEPAVSLPEENQQIVVDEKENIEGNDELATNGIEKTSEELHDSQETVVNSTENEPVQPVSRDLQITNDTSDIIFASEETENLKLYEEFMTSGHAKRLSKDYKGALADFEKARDYHLTEDVVLLTIEMRTHIEEEEIAQRRAQYEEKMPFGPYMIVKKKNNDRYGAIDEKGFEIIPCEYVIARIADSGRAFLREDDLYDIYDDNGNLMNKGVSSY
jgi:serine/threonine-protein kinase